MRLVGDFIFLHTTFAQIKVFEAVKNRLSWK